MIRTMRSLLSERTYAFVPLAVMIRAVVGSGAVNDQGANLRRRGGVQSCVTSGRECPGSVSLTLSDCAHENDAVTPVTMVTRSVPRRHALAGGQGRRREAGEPARPWRQRAAQ